MLKVILQSFLQACKNTIIGVSILAIIMGILIFFYSNFNPVVVFVGFVLIINFVICCLLNFGEVKEDTMRNPNRLYNFYNEVTRLHMTYFPDWRVGQFWMNFLGWVQNEKKLDLFFPEESEMITYLKEFCGEKEDNMNG